MKGDDGTWGWTMSEISILRSRASPSLVCGESSEKGGGGQSQVS